MDRYDQQYEYVIIGGGMAGLSAANRLSDLGKTALLIDAGKFPSHKVCGEFFSPECLSILQEWGISPKGEINKTRYVCNNRSFEFTLPLAAGSHSRYDFDNKLALRAKRQGALFLTSVRVDKIEKSALFRLHLSNGESVTTPNLIVSSGRAIATEKKPLHFVGVKAHFSGIEMEQTLEMHSLKGGYFGISNIEDGKTNVTGLVEARFFDSFFQAVKANKRVSSAQMLYSDWQKVSAPQFGIASHPTWKNCYFIGDAAATIHPASGDGLAMAITSGVMAANYAIKRDYIGFKKAWKLTYQERLSWAKRLHELLIRPSCAQAAILASKTFGFKSFTRYIFRKTRGL